MPESPATNEPDHELVARVRTVLGARLTAYIGGAASTVTVRNWATPGLEVSPEVIARLRIADTVAGLLLQRDEPAVVQSWFTGMNTDLNDIAPARLLRDEDPQEVRQRLMTAATAALSA